MTPTRRRWLAAAVMQLVAVLTVLMTIRRADDPDARVAYAEFLVAVGAGAKARDAAARVRAMVGAAGPAARAAAERLLAEAAAAARDADEHAARLRAEWGGRWRHIGLAER